MQQHLNALEVLRQTFVEYLRQIVIEKDDILKNKIDFVIWKEQAHCLEYRGDLEDSFLDILVSEIDLPS